MPEPPTQEDEMEYLCTDDTNGEPLSIDADPAKEAAQDYAGGWGTGERGVMVG